MSLTEQLLVLAIIAGGLIAGVFTYEHYVNTSSVDTTYSNIIKLSQNVQKGYSTVNNFSDLTNEVILQAGWAPLSMLHSSNTQDIKLGDTDGIDMIANFQNGTKNVDITTGPAGNDREFYIGLTGMTQDQCSNLGKNAINSNANVAFLSASAQGGDPIQSISALTASCNNGSLYFIFSK